MGKAVSDELIAEETALAGKKGLLT